MSTNPSVRHAALVGLVLAAAATRLLPHPPNVTPVLAMALFGGAAFASRRLAFAVPLGAMLVSDLVIGGSTGASAFGFHPVQPFVYAALFAIVLLGRVSRPRRAGGVAAASLVSSVGFFVVTNLGVWLVSGLYPRTAAGLSGCFVAALPFFRNTLLSTLGFAAILFALRAVVERGSERTDGEPAPSPVRRSGR
ncbi:MAG: DUF6580 family putative transport protein [Planctomycetota bacterium JB042]